MWYAFGQKSRNASLESFRICLTGFFLFPNRRVTVDSAEVARYWFEPYIFYISKLVDVYIDSSARRSALSLWRSFSHCNFECVKKCLFIFDAKHFEKRSRATDVGVEVSIDSSHTASLIASAFFSFVSLLSFDFEWKPDESQIIVR